MWRSSEVKKCGGGVKLRYHLFVSCVIKGTRKRGEFKISLSNLKGRKIILNSSESTRELVGEERRDERGAVNIGEGCGTHCMKFVTPAIPSQSEAYLDTSRTSAMELFTKVLNLLKH